MNRYKNQVTSEIKTHKELDISFGHVIIPKDGTPVIATDWLLINKTEAPAPSDPLLKGVREVTEPTGFDQEWEEYDLSEEEKTDKQNISDDISKAEITNDFSTALSPVKSAYGSDERELWRKLEEEARAWDADNSVSTRCIDFVIAKSLEDKQTYVTSIIDKADIFEELAFTALGNMRLAKS